MSMPGEGVVTVARDLEQVFSHRTPAGPSEGPLVRRFVSGRHGPACKAGVLRGRLKRARLRLRGRLVRRGVAPAATATMAVTELIVPPAHAAVPAALLTATLAAAGRDLTVGKVAGAVAVSSAVK